MWIPYPNNSEIYNVKSTSIFGDYAIIGDCFQSRDTSIRCDEP